MRHHPIPKPQNLFGLNRISTVALIIQAPRIEPRTRLILGPPRNEVVVTLRLPNGRTHTPKIPLDNGHPPAFTHAAVFEHFQEVAVPEEGVVGLLALHLLAVGQGHVALEAEVEPK